MEIQHLLGSDIQMQLDECIRLPCAEDEARARDAAFAALGRALARAPSARSRAMRSSASCRAALRPALRTTSAQALVDIGFRRLCARRPRGRRAAGRDARDDRDDACRICRRTGRAISWASARPTTSSKRCGAASTCSIACMPTRAGPAWPRLHAARPHQSAQCAHMPTIARPIDAASPAQLRATIRAPISTTL